MTKYSIKRSWRLTFCLLTKDPWHVNDGEMFLIGTVFFDFEDVLTECWQLRSIG